MRLLQVNQPIHWGFLPDGSEGQQIKGEIMGKFRQGDLVRILECDNPAFLGFEGAVTKVYEPGGGESGALPDGDGGAVHDSGVAHYDVQLDMLNAPLRRIAEDDLELA